MDGGCAAAAIDSRPAGRATGAGARVRWRCRATGARRADLDPWWRLRFRGGWDRAGASDAGEGAWAADRVGRLSAGAGGEVSRLSQRQLCRAQMGARQCGAAGRGCGQDRGRRIECGGRPRGDAGDRGARPEGDSARLPGAYLSHAGRSHRQQRSGAAGHGPVHLDGGGEPLRLDFASRPAGRRREPACRRRAGPAGGCARAGAGLHRHGNAGSLLR